MKIDVNGLKINYEVSGQTGGPWVILSHSLACNLHMWDPQVKALENSCRVLRYDTRGHGRSDAPQGPYSLDMLGADAVGLLDALRIDTAHWVGLSMGGMIGQFLALNYPQRLKGLVLCDTGPLMPDEAQPIWQARIDEARKGGMAARLKTTFEDWFTPELLKQNPPVLKAIQKQFLATPVEGYVGCIEAIRKLNYIDRLNEIHIPTLIMVGKEDFGTPVEVSQIMHAMISDSTLVVLPAAAHLSSVAQPEAFNTALLDFLKAH